MNEPAVALPADPFSTSLSGRRLGRYEVLARLASGGMAGVYVARALGVAGFERLFAVKVLHPHLAHEEEFITMFLDEARLAARIRHPNVVPTIDISDTQDAGYYLVMDYIEGDHLGALLQKAYRQGTRLPVPVTLRIMLDALEGLGAAHRLTDEAGQRLNLVHRDVSPHNIMVSTDGIARITDFGVAKAEARQASTNQGQFKGKLAYMAPEQASTGESDQRSDLFSIGIVLWECLTGTRLFRAENQAATLTMICIDPIRLPSEIDPELAIFDSLLTRALARDPNERFQSAEEFAEAIEEGIDAFGGLANQRAVAKLVREYAADKIEGDRDLIRNAIADLGANPEPERMRASHDSTRPAASEAQAVQAQQLAAPQPSSALAERPSWRGGLWIGVGVLVLATIGIAVAAFMMRGQAPAVTASPLLPAPVSTPVAAPQAPIIPQENPVLEAQQPSVPSEAQPPTTPQAAQPAAQPSQDSAPTQPRRTTKQSSRRSSTERSKPSTVTPRSDGETTRTPPTPQQDLLLNPYRKR